MKKFVYKLNYHGGLWVSAIYTLTEEVVNISFTQRLADHWGIKSPYKDIRLSPKGKSIIVCGKHHIRIPKRPGILLDYWYGKLYRHCWYMHCITDINYVSEDTIELLFADNFRGKVTFTPAYLDAISVFNPSAKKRLEMKNGFTFDPYFLSPRVEKLPEFLNPDEIEDELDKYSDIMEDSSEIREAFGEFNTNHIIYDHPKDWTVVTAKEKTND